MQLSSGVVHAAAPIGYASERTALGAIERTKCELQLLKRAIQPSLLSHLGVQRYLTWTGAGHGLFDEADDGN